MRAQLLLLSLPFHILSPSLGHMYQTSMLSPCLHISLLHHLLTSDEPAFRKNKEMHGYQGSLQTVCQIPTSSGRTESDTSERKAVFSQSLHILTTFKLFKVAQCGAPVILKLRSDLCCQGRRWRWETFVPRALSLYLCVMQSSFRSEPLVWQRAALFTNGERGASGVWASFHGARQVKALINNVEPPPYGLITSKDRDWGHMYWTAGK